MHVLYDILHLFLAQLSLSDQLPVVCLHLWGSFTRPISTKLGTQPGHSIVKANCPQKLASFQHFRQLIFSIWKKEFHQNNPSFQCVKCLLHHHHKINDKQFFCENDVETCLATCLMASLGQDLQNYLNVGPFPLQRGDYN